nr:hypothetical protein [Candidatus Njordarchaeota archaeon]
MRKRRALVSLLSLMIMTVMSFSNVSRTAAFPPGHANVAENVAWWPLNVSRTVTAVELSNRNPLVGDRVKVTVRVSDSTTGNGISSLLADLEVISPSGNLLLREAHLTYGNGCAEFSQMLLTEVGEHHMTVEITHGGENVSKITDIFKVGYRVEIVDAISEIHVTQGEQTTLELNLTYASTSLEDMALRLVGEPFVPDISFTKSLKHGYNNVTFAITVSETVPVGEYNVSLLIVPTTMEYVAGCYNFTLIVTPAYDVSIVEAPSTVTQGSSFRLVVEVRSHRSTAVTATLRIVSYNILLHGETTTMILAGETRQVILTIGEASTSPYQWGEGKIKITLVRNGFPVVESSSFTVLVSPSFTSVIVGYVLPVTLPLPILVERSRKIKTKLAATGTILGGTLFFLIGVMIYQSPFMIVPLTMLIAGCYVGVAAVRHAFDLPLPKEYNWLVLSHGGNTKNGTHKSGGAPSSAAILMIPEYAVAGLRGLRDLHEMNRYRETIPMAYTLIAEVLSDWSTTASDVKPRVTGEDNNRSAEQDKSKTLTMLIRQLRQHGIVIPSESKLKRLDRLYRNYVELSKQGSKDTLPEARLKTLSTKSIGLVTHFISQSK